LAVSLHPSGSQRGGRSWLNEAPIVWQADCGPGLPSHEHLAL
jgi:hypothetical protein